MQYSDLDDFLRDLPLHAAHAADKLGDRRLLCLLETRQGRSVYVKLDQGVVTVSDTADAMPDCTLRADENVLLDVICGRLNPAKAILLRRITVQGNVQALMSLIALI